MQRTERVCLLCWMALHIVYEGERTEWVLHMTMPVSKAILSFTTKLFCTIVCIRLSPAQAEKWLQGIEL